MRRIFAIALITVRNAIRSKIIISLLCMLIAVIILLPVTIRGDGTVSGFIQILLSYTLGLSGLVLSLSTLWAGCASVSSEIVEKTIQMVATKPVSRFQLWTGKWIGINLLNAGLLVTSGAVTYAMLHWHLRRDEFQQEEAAATVDQLLSARQVYAPVWDGLEEEIEQQYRELAMREVFPDTMTVQEAKNAVRTRLIHERNTAKPDGAVTWNFGTIPDVNQPRFVTLDFRFSPSAIGASMISGRWTAGTPDQPELFSSDRTFAGRTLQSIMLPLDERWSGKEYIVTFQNTGENGVTLLFDTADTVLLVQTGGFAGNYIRTLLIMFGRLSFLAALGVTAGCMFSLPVASFLSLFLLTVLQLGSYIQQIAGQSLAVAGEESRAATLLTFVTSLVFKLMAVLIAPLQHTSPLNDLSTGRLVGWAWTFNGLVFQGLVLSLLMGLAGSWILRKRELSLPQS